MNNGGVNHDAARYPKARSPVMCIEHFCPDIPKSDDPWSLTLHARIALKAFATGSATNSEAGNRA